MEKENSTNAELDLHAKQYCEILSFPLAFTEKQRTERINSILSIHIIIFTNI